jgi:hypothetical protein
MIFRLVMAAFLIISVGGSRSAKAAYDDVFASIEAEYAFQIDYKKYKKFKAFATGSFGSYGYSWDYASQKEADREAVRQCQNDLKYWAKKYHEKGRCEIFARGNTVIEGKKWFASELEIPIKGTGNSFISGAVTYANEIKPNGIILAVHGCNGLGWDKYHEISGSYFRALGFHYFAPNSFSAPRPAEICGNTTPSRAQDHTRIFKLRISQTKQAITDLKAKYPGVPIYVWGHSEGAAVVELLDTSVSGLIVSGDECGVEGQRIAAPQNVPILYMFGDHDPFIDGYNFPLTDKKMRGCSKYVRTKNLKTVVVKNSTHDMWLWRPEIAKALSTFITGKERSLPKVLPPVTLTLNGEQQKGMAEYGSAKGHRAFAAKSAGAFSWSGQWEYAADAEQFVLYECAHFDNENIFVTGTQTCVVVDVDGKAKNAAPTTQ